MKDIVQKRLDSYNPTNSNEELNALKEITQEISLYALYKTGFFQQASFIGGTSLRILHGLERFSEDLDFSTHQKDENFNLDSYLENAISYMNAYGYDLSIAGGENADKNIKSRFLKDDSIKKILTFQHSQDFRSKIKVKVEVDINPPLGATHKIEYVDFPLNFPVVAFDLPSLMSGKLHALLCRPFNKGRDWFDFLWYITNKTKPNYELLSNALFQLGPWKEKKIKVGEVWIKEELQNKIEKIDWKETSNDVKQFLKPNWIESLKHWNTDFFQDRVKKLNI